MPQRYPLRSSSHLRASSSDSESLRSRPLTDRSPKLRGDRRSPKGSQSDPSTQKKLGSRISDLENQLGLAQEELKCLKEQLASTATSKKMAPEILEKNTRKPAVVKPEEVPATEKENLPEKMVLDFCQQENDVFEAQMEKVAMDPNDDIGGEYEAKTRTPSPSFEPPLTPEQQKPSLENDGVSSLKAKLEEKEKELANSHLENEGLKQKLNKKEIEAISAKSKEEETALQLSQVREELETAKDNAAMLNDKLEASEKAKEMLETEMKKLHIQTEQWRKAADAAATLLSGDMETKGRGMSERYCHSVLQPVVGGYGSYVVYPGLFDESEDVSESARKKGSGIKMFGDLWKRKSQKQ
ncbi:hypothetical protein DM860_015056 [Cuscuta australis]|uniref:Interactor of constitutive active ROPs 4-like n=1 Tax=Cuscuta australis TaxID=267555 RepID=A0A328DTM0_9ASTE|nr:hypothetical protein DM860_015056 [Cuscuta australis]